jgi:sterol desaturase/sphingolipid hydroxylase (fatty acid hydroxylase superfamily)
MAMQHISSDSKQVFAHPLLDRLSRCHPILPAILWVPMAMVLFVMGVRDGLSVSSLGGLFVAGLFLWTLSEYILHRWVFHLEFRSATLNRIWYPVHKLHHDIQERERLVAPPLMSVPLFFVFLGAFYAWPGMPYMLPLFSGFIIGYLAYDYIHYYTHFARPTSAIGKGLRKRHLQHHFAFNDKWFGISTPLWDYVFGTYVREGERARRRSNEESAIAPVN